MVVLFPGTRVQNAVYSVGGPYMCIWGARGGGSGRDKRRSGQWFMVKGVVDWMDPACGRQLEPVGDRVGLVGDVIWSTIA